MTAKDQQPSRSVRQALRLGGLAVALAGLAGRRDGFFARKCLRRISAPPPKARRLEFVIAVKLREPDTEPDADARA